MRGAKFSGHFRDKRRPRRRIAVMSINCKVPIVRMILKKCAALFTVMAKVWRLR
jgi:hypothetical protein